jgi:thioredoxin 1
MYELIDFYGNSCVPCKMIAPKIDNFIKEKDIKLNKIEIYDNIDEAKKYGVLSIPTLILLKEGEEIFRTTGVDSINILEKYWEIL